MSLSGHKARKIYLLIPVAILVMSLSACSAISSLTGSNTELTAETPLDSEERANPGQARDNTPVVLAPTQPGSAGVWDANATLDYSNAASGYICLESYLGATKVKALVYAPDGNRYQYTITSDDGFVTIPLSQGSGTYSVAVYQNMYDDQYAAMFSQDIYVELNNEYDTFLYPNQFVNFREGDAAVQLSQQVTENATSDLEALEQIYMYVVQHISYDMDKAASVAPGYLPNNDDTIATQTGICFDFASLTASMLRAQGLPCKLDIGYCGQAYHAWIEVYTSDQGWVRKKIEFKGDGSWTRMDPTFDSSYKGKGDIGKIIGDGKNYDPLFYH